MKKEEYMGQDEQVSLMIGRIKKLLEERFDNLEIASLIRNVIQMRESGGNEETIKTYISSEMKVRQNDELADKIFEEITEKPFQNNYYPFQNKILEQLKKNLEKE
jgi:hypothetical protein